MKRLRLCMLGFGIAGKAFSEILVEKHDEILKKTDVDVVVTSITTGSHGSFVNKDGIDLQSALDVYRATGGFDKTSPCFRSMTTMEAVDNCDDYDVLLELTPLNIFTGMPAIDHIKHALERKKHVVSANKGPLAWAYKELKELAAKNGVLFLFETTVMAGTPVFNMAEAGLKYCTVSKLEGIFNATTNYILKEMSKGVPYETILVNGRNGGFMEADPSMDTKGYDAAAKLTVLLNVLMDADITPDMIDRTGIEAVTLDDIAAAKARGNVIKLLCRGEIVDGKVVGKVAPEEIPMDDVFADEDLVAVLSLYTDLMGKLTMMQYGLDPWQTGYGVFVDVCTVAENI